MLTGVGYTVRGDLPGLPLADVWFVSVDAGGRIDARNTLGATYYRRQASSSRVDAPEEISLYHSVELPGGRLVTAHVLHGLSDSSPEWGGGVSLGVGY